MCNHYYNLRIFPHNQIMHIGGKTTEDKLMHIGGSSTVDCAGKRAGGENHGRRNES